MIIDDKRAEIHVFSQTNNFFGLTILTANGEIYYFENLTPKEIGERIIETLNFN